MRSRNLFVGFLLVSTLAGTAADFSESPSDLPVLRKTAVFVDNRAGSELNREVAVLEDLLAAQIAGHGFAVLSRDLLTRSLKAYTPAPDLPPAVDPTRPRLDEWLEQQTTALRLAQTLGADFILAASIVSQGTEERTYTGNEVNTVNRTSILRVAYRIAGAGDGGAIHGGTATVSKTLRQTPNLQLESDDILNQLLADAASQMAEALVRAAPGLPAASPTANWVTFTVACGMTEPIQNLVTIPDIRLAEDGEMLILNDPLPVEALQVTVEIDGIVAGSTPSVFRARPGLHRMRLTRNGFVPWERYVNLYDGQALRVALEMTPEAFARWQDRLTFLQGLENERKLTDAEVEVLRGRARMLEQSGYRANIRVDTEEGFRQYKSIY